MTRGAVRQKGSFVNVLKGGQCVEVAINAKAGDFYYIVVIDVKGVHK